MGGGEGSDGSDQAVALASRLRELERSGLACFQAGDFDGAAGLFHEVARAAPQRFQSWNNVALVLSALDHHAEAVTALTRSLDLSSAQPTTWVSLATSRLRLDQPVEAERACDAALALDPGLATAWRVLAHARGAQNNFPGAAEAFVQAIELNGPSADLSADLGATLLKCGRFEAAAAELRLSLELDPSRTIASDALEIVEFVLSALAGGPLPLPGDGDPTDRFAKSALLLLDAAGHRAAALRVAEAWAARRPESLEAQHLLEAVAERPLTRYPADLVSQRFDEMAETFDTVLTTRLGYDGPRQLGAMLAPLNLPARALDVLDLGCGTGLSAPVLAPYARRLDGVDLSANMLEKARARALYDSLLMADLTEALAVHDARYDLIVAMDTLPYLGDLGVVFEQVARALRPGGRFAFSTERFDGATYQLQGNGRFAHGGDYIRAIGAESFGLLSEITTVLRLEGGRAVPGGYYLLQRKT